MNAPHDPYGLLGKLIEEKYFLEEVVGEGGFGIVYRARHEIWNQSVALKCFTALSNAPKQLREELLEQFIREGKLLNELSSHSSSIVQARDIGTLTTPDGIWLPYMVLEWLDGTSLDRFMVDEQGYPCGKKFSVEEVFRLLDGVARALALAHGHGVAHRDIKPANFFVCSETLVPGCIIKLLDFGIAKVMQGQAGGSAMLATGTHINSFTPNYGAPEQFDRNYGATGPWTDVYGMALVMVELMNGGKPALQGEEFMQLAYASQNTLQRPTPRGLGLTVSDAVENVFAKALAIHVIDRFKDMETFWLALVEALNIENYSPLKIREILAARRQTALQSDIRTSALVRQLDQQEQTPSSTAPASTSVRTLISPTGTSNTDSVNQQTTVDTPQHRKSKKLVVASGTAVLCLASGFAIYYSVLKSPNEEEGTAALPVVAPLAKHIQNLATQIQASFKPPPCPKDMIFVAGGKFFMGTDEKNPILTLAFPAQQVEVDSFCMDTYEVTAGDYRACSDQGECRRAYRDSYWPQGSSNAKDWQNARKIYSELCTGDKSELAKHPINCVTWVQASEYCAKKGKRLPAEKEWEYAARGSDGRIYPWPSYRGDRPGPEHFNGCGLECTKWREEVGLPENPALYEAEDGYIGTAPVGSFPAGKTQLGLFDMVGNVFEWTADAYQAYPQAGAEAEPLPEPDANKRVIRGGAFNSFQAEHADPALRFPMDIESHSHGVGFRCASDPNPKTL